MTNHANNNHLIAIIQARMQSTRLPGKVLLPMPLKDGKPMIQWIVDQLSASLPDAAIVVATSVEKEDDVLAGYCKEHNIECFRGDEEDVLSRFISITRSNGEIDVVARVTGDNPVLDGEVFQKTLGHHLSEGNDYTGTAGLPIGMNVELLSAGALMDLDTESLTDEEKEHVTLHFKNNDRFKKGTLHFSNPMEIEQVRLTVDYPSDYLVLSTLLSFYNPDSLSGLNLVKKLYNDHPWLFEVNRENVQKKQFTDAGAELDVAVELLKTHDLHRAADRLKGRSEK